MSKREKAINKIRRNPKNVRFEDIEIILAQYGFRKRQMGTSHAVFVFDKYRITIPHKQPFIKTVYVKLVLEILDQIELAENSQEKVDIDDDKND